MAPSATATCNAILLKGSVDIIAEFFGFAVHSILYQRGIYPPEMFTRLQKYGLTLLVSTNEGLKTFLHNVMGQIQEWMLESKVKRIAMVITEVATKQTRERWDFIISQEPDKKDEKVGTKDVKDVHKEIGAVIRQITASVTFLPLLETACSFDLLVYTDNDLEVPDTWQDTVPCLIANSQEVKLRSFSTSVHKLDTVVSYQIRD